jgi:hypothetical protein
MEHDLNKSPSYEHLMGKEQRAHLGSQSNSPTSKKGENEGLKEPMSKGTPAGKEI